MPARGFWDLTWSSEGGSRTILSLPLGYSVSEMRSSSDLITFIVCLLVRLASSSELYQGGDDLATTGVQRTRVACQDCLELGACSSSNAGP